MATPAALHESGTANKLAWWVAWRLPRRLVYWCAVRVVAQATTGVWSHTIVPELTAMEALRRWDVPEAQAVDEITQRG